MALILRIFGVLISFAVSFLVARLLGASGSGVYFLFLSFAIMGATISRFGLDDTVVRFISAKSAVGNYSDVYHVNRFAIQFVCITSLLVSVIMVICAGWVADELLDKPFMKVPIIMAAICVLPISLSVLYGESLRGLKSIFSSELIKLVGIPAVTLVLLYPMYLRSGAMGIIMAYVVGAVVVGCVSWYTWRKICNGLSEVPAQPSRSTIAESLVRSSWPLFGVAITGLVMQQSGTFFIGMSGSIEDVGIFSVALRISGLLLFPLQAASTIIAPKFSEMYSQGNIFGVQRLAQQATRVLTCIAIPSVLVIGLSSNWIMGVFGPSFSEGGFILNILLIGVLVNAVTGPVGYLLIMCGHEYLVRNINISAAVVTIIACYIMTPVLQGVGAAIAIATGMVFKNMLMVIMVRVKLRFNILGFIINEK